MRKARIPALFTVIALVTAMFIAAGGPGALGKGGKDGATSSRPVRISSRAFAPAAPLPSGWDSERAWSNGDDWEPDVAFDPSSNYAYMATTRYGGTPACSRCPSPAIIVRASADNGATWGADKYICACTGIKTQNDPELEVATDGTIYAAWMNDYNPGIVFAKSTDHGNTWTAPISLKGKGLSFTDKPNLTISPTGKDVYVAFNSSNAYVVASHDFGKTFGTRVQTNADSLYYFAEGGVVAPNGNVYFSESAENQNATGQVKVRVIKSTNLGVSWTATVIDTSEQQPACTVLNCGADFYASQIDIAVDANNKLAVLYSANTVAGANKSLYLKTSTDNGTTWSARSVVNAQGDSGFPKIDNGPTANDFRVAWIDSRTGGFNTYYKRTTDGGATWGTEAKLSDLTSGAPYKSSTGFTFPYGDYFGFATDTTGQNLAAWGEGPNYDGPGGTWFTKG